MTSGSAASRHGWTSPAPTPPASSCISSGWRSGGDCPEDGIVTSAAKCGVPLFCPAIGDSSIGIGVAESRHRGENRLMFDMMADVLEITNAVADSKATGVIYFGGGTPKNYTQQSEVVAILMNRGKDGHRYGVQIVTDAPHWADSRAAP